MNIANKITMARIILVPIIMFFLLVQLEDIFAVLHLPKLDPITIQSSDFVGSFQINYNQIVATIIFIIAASTDGLDGYIARKKKAGYQFGEIT